MAKHRLDKPSAGARVAKSAVVTGALAIGGLTAGGLAVAAAPAHAAPIHIPNVGQFELPGINKNQIPDQFKPGNGGNILAPKQTRGERALHFAESKIGSPYSYGAAGPNAFDCSGLVYWSYKQTGKVIPRDSYGQLGGGTPVSSIADARPGDVLIFNGGGHAGIYAGNGVFVHSSTYGVPVKRDRVKAWSLTGIRRY